MWQYHYTDTLCHYGVVGMKWGVRRAAKYRSKARVARGSAKEWDDLAKRSEQAGKHKRAAQYRSAAAKDRLDAKAYDNKASRAAKGASKTKKTPLTPEQKKARNKKIVGGVLAAIGTAAVVAGTVAYIKNRDKVNSSVANFFKKKRPTIKEKAANKRMMRDVKRRRTLSDADLQKKINRIKMERELKNLTAEELRPGRTAAKKVLITAGTSAATTMATGGILYGTKVAITKKSDRKDAADYITPKPKKK